MRVSGPTPSPALTTPLPPAPAAARAGTAPAPATLPGWLGEAAILAAQLESSRVASASARAVIRGEGTKISADHELRLQQLTRSIEAAARQGLWQKLLAACKVLGALGAACTGNPVALAAAALLVASLALERTHPQAALGLQLAALGLTATSAAGGLAGAVAAPAGVSTTTWGATALPQYLSAGALAGAGGATVAVGHYGAVATRAEAARLRGEARLEGARLETRAALDSLRELAAADARAREAVLDLLAARAQTTRTLWRA